MDALSEILRAARLTGGVFLHGEFTEPWCLSSDLKASDCSHLLGPTDHMVLFHYVIEGCLTVVTQDRDAKVFLPGQAVILPRNDPHILKGRAPTNTIPALDVTERRTPHDLMIIRHGGGGEKTQVICGFLSGQGLKDNPLINSLPSVFRYDGNLNPSGPAVCNMLNLATDDMHPSRLGTDAALASISELLFIEAVRDHVGSSNEGGLIRALKDRAVSQAIGLIHRTPAARWTVPLLAKECAVSQSVLTERFNATVGCSPGDYLTNTRLQIAARELNDRKLSVQECAELVGYNSEAAFSRAFKRRFGVAPSFWRIV